MNKKIKCLIFYKKQKYSIEIVSSFFSILKYLEENYEFLYYDINDKLDIIKLYKEIKSHPDVTYLVSSVSLFTLKDVEFIFDFKNVVIGGSVASGGIINSLPNLNTQTLFDYFNLNYSLDYFSIKLPQLPNKLKNIFSKTKSGVHLSIPLSVKKCYYNKCNFCGFNDFPNEFSKFSSNINTYNYIIEQLSDFKKVNNIKGDVTLTDSNSAIIPEQLDILIKVFKDKKEYNIKSFLRADAFINKYLQNINYDLNNFLFYIGLESFSDKIRLEFLNKNLYWENFKQLFKINKERSIISNIDMILGGFPIIDNDIFDITQKRLNEIVDIFGISRLVKFDVNCLLRIEKNLQNHPLFKNKELIKIKYFKKHENIYVFVIKDTLDFYNKYIEYFLSLIKNSNYFTYVDNILLDGYLDESFDFQWLKKYIDNKNIKWTWLVKKSKL